MKKDKINGENILKKKILVLFGSPHKNGNTNKLLNFFIKPLEKNFEISFFDAYTEMFFPCVDCGSCKEFGNCNFDDLQKLNTVLESCDLIVIASPIYNLGLPAPLKSLLDRFQPYYNFYLQNNRYKLEKEKKVFLLLTCGRRKDDFVTEAIERQLNTVLKYLNAKIFYKFIWDKTDEGSELNKRQLDEIKKMSDSLMS